MGRYLAGSQEDQIVEGYRAGTTIAAICSEVGTSKRSAYNVLKRRGVMRRRRTGARRLDWTDGELLRLAELRRQGATKDDLRDEFRCGSERLDRALRNLGLADRMPRRDLKERVVNGQGYAYVLTRRDDPIAAPMAQSSGYVFEHRLVVARSVGRPLRSDETVHHINGDRLDNRLENLQLRSGKHGRGVHLVCLDCGSHNVDSLAI